MNEDTGEFEMLGFQYSVSSVGCHVMLGCFTHAVCATMENLVIAFKMQ